MARVKKNQTVYLEGFEELNKALRNVGDRAGGLTLAKAAREASEIIAEEAKRLAPKDTGALAEGIDVVPQRIQVGRAQINVGIGKDEWYGQLQELGTEHMPAQPFLRPAFDAKKDEAIEKVGEVLRDSLKDVLS